MNPLVEQHGVIVVPCTIDDDVAPGGHRAHDVLRHQVAHLLVIEGDIEIRLRAPHETIVAKHGNALRLDL